MNQKIVNLRAFAIILIVLGHSIIIYDRTFDLLNSDVEMPIFEVLKHAISFIQLKLFFSISGFLMFYKINKDTSLGLPIKLAVQFVWKKVYRLLVPFVCVCLIWMDPIKILLGVEGYYLNWNLILQQLQFLNCGHLWYLPCLFIIFIVMYIVLNLIRKNIFGLSFLFLVLAWLNYMHGHLPDTFQIQNAAYYIYYFYLGYLINCLGSRYVISNKKFNIKYIVSSAIVLFFIIGFLLYKITSIGFDFYLSSVLVILCYILMSNSSNKVITAISENSYGIYLFHSPMIYITALNYPNINPWLMLFINFFVFGGVAYAMTVAISKSKLRFIIGLKY